MTATKAARWRELDRRLGDWHVSRGGPGAAVPADTLLLDRTTPLPESHRHLSNLMPLHPFNLITVDGDDRDRRIIAASLSDWEGKGTALWCGYSFSWMACLRARAGDAEGALRNLDIYARAFVLRNGFHANGDQTKSGYSRMTYRPFTLEGNFLAMDAVHERPDGRAAERPRPVHAAASAPSASASSDSSLHSATARAGPSTPARITAMRSHTPSSSGM